MNEQILEVLTAIRDQNVEILRLGGEAVRLGGALAADLRKISEALADLNTLAERRKRDADRKRHVRGQTDVRGQEENEREKEKFPPHPPIEKEGKEKEDSHTLRAREGFNANAAFDRFWDEYPRVRRVDKRRSRDKFMRILKEAKDPEALIKQIFDGLDRWKRSDIWVKDEGQYVCAPLVWLNNERWEADVAEARTMHRDETPHERHERELRERQDEYDSFAVQIAREAFEKGKLL